jgi:hypothetical protein
MSDKEPTIQPGSNETSGEISIDEIPAALKFNEADDMEPIKERLVSALAAGTDDATLKELWSMYENRGEDIVNVQSRGPELTAAQVGYDLAKGLIRQRAAVLAGEGTERWRQLLFDYKDDLKAIWAIEETLGSKGLNAVEDRYLQAINLEIDMIYDLVGARPQDS